MAGESLKLHANWGTRTLVHFTDECVIVSSWYQKTFDRAFKELSNGVYFSKIRLKLAEIFVIEDNETVNYRTQLLNFSFN
jgi:hypothetical protein